MAKVIKFFHPKGHTGWEHGMPLKKRRALALKGHKRDYLATSRSLQALSNVTVKRNPVVSRAAKADAKYFLKLYHRGK